jgi:hypothetical protein
MINPILALLAAVIGLVSFIEYKKGNNYRFYLIVALALAIAAVIPLFLPVPPPPTSQADPPTKSERLAFFNGFASLAGLN